MSQYQYAESSGKHFPTKTGVTLTPEEFEELQRYTSEVDVQVICLENKRQKQEV